MVFTKLAGGIALCLQNGGQRYCLRRDTDVGASLTHGRQPSADRQLAGDEIGATCRAAGFRIVVGEPHPLRGKPVEVWRLPGHDALVIGTDIEPAYIVAHDDEDVRLRCCCANAGALATTNAKNNPSNPSQTFLLMITTELHFG